MLAALDPLSSNVVAGYIVFVGSVVGGAAVRLMMKSRAEKKEKITAETAGVVSRLGKLEVRVDGISNGLTGLTNGLFGYDTPFGHVDGFVDEMRTSVGAIHAEVTPNGGKSMKDVSNETHRRQTEDPNA